MPSQNDTIWWMTDDGRMRVGSMPPAGTGFLARGTVRLDGRSGVITELHGEPATLGKLPRALLDELAARFPDARWWVQDVPERSAVRSAQ